MTDIVKKDYSFLEPKYTYSEHVVAAIFRKLKEGKKLHHICNQDGFPSMIEVMKWRKEHPEFREALMLYVEARTWTLMERMIDDADSMDELTRDEVQTKKFQNDVRKFLVEKTHDEFNNVQKHQHEGEVVTKIVLDTGIVRDLDAAQKELEVYEAQFTKEEDGKEDPDGVRSETSPEDSPQQPKEI